MAPGMTLCFEINFHLQSIKNTPPRKNDASIINLNHLMTNGLKTVYLLIPFLGRQFVRNSFVTTLAFLLFCTRDGAGYRYTGTGIPVRALDRFCSFCDFIQIIDQYSHSFCTHSLTEIHRRRRLHTSGF